MIDLHSHILPGVDDGAKDMAEALAMAEMAVASGVRIMVATPHGLSSPYNVGLTARDLVLKELQLALRQHGIALELLPGMECWADEKALDEALGQPGCFMNYCAEMPHRRSLLVECPPQFDLSLIDGLLFRAQVRGITLILAHPERHPDFARRERLLAAMMGKGLVLQINAETIRPRFWPGSQERVIKRLLVHSPEQVVLASDTHSRDGRPPNLAQAREVVCKWFDAGMWRQLTWLNPSRLLGLEAACCQQS